ncbi:DUF1080 domain-containing protein [Telluribacter sp.]|jgi:hypothetical protein|uniref:3-keto-disaccharide hydrolase n=1 Tax=Telluribacter sp. TaxID=1978767 RepID=UPI002E0E1EB8|nr:DUF1080 domain-containing protein [Telluribacter sp.]
MRFQRYWYLLPLVSSSLLLYSFADVNPNELTAQEKKDGWKLLFDGKTTKGWHLYNKGKVTSAWTVRNGELYCMPDNYKVEHGDLVSDQQYEDYDLQFEWKISEAGNSGVFINVLEREDLPTAWASGLEYQLLEKSHYDKGASDNKQAGCLYGFYPQKNPAPDKPAGQWNQSRITQKDGNIQFYLNGVLTAEEDLTSAGWKQVVADSHFKTFPEFGKHTKGHLALQDWSKGISFRNIKIKEL